MIAGVSSVVNINQVVMSIYSDETPHISEFCLLQQASTRTLKRTEQNLILRIGKSEAELTNNKRLRSRYYTVEANYRQSRAASLFRMWVIVPLL